MASKTDIFNRALSEVGDLRVAVDTELTGQAKACNAAWTTVLEELLVEHPWNFAKIYKTLTREIATPEWRWTYSFVLPPDYLTIREVELQRDDWEVVANKKLYSNTEGPINISYTANITDTTRYSPGFVTALGYRLAAEIVEELTQSNTKKQDVFAIYERRLKKAKRQDGREAPPQTQKSGRWVRARQI